MGSLAIFFIKNPLPPSGERERLIQTYCLSVFLLAEDDNAGTGSDRNDAQTDKAGSTGYGRLRTGFGLGGLNGSGLVGDNGLDRLVGDDGLNRLIHTSTFRIAVIAQTIGSCCTTLAIGFWRRSCGRICTYPQRTAVIALTIGSCCTTLAIGFWRRNNGRVCTNP